MNRADVSCNCQFGVRRINELGIVNIQEKFRARLGYGWAIRKDLVVFVSMNTYSCQDRLLPYLVPGSSTPLSVI